GDPDRGARGIWLFHVLRHDLVDAREVREIGEIDRHPHGVLEPEPGRGGDRGEVAEHAMGLRVDALDHLHRRRIQPDLSRDVDRIAGADRLRISADRLGRVARLDGALHGGYLSVVISSLEKLLGTPRDGALLRYSLGLEYAKAGERERAIEFLREAVTRD